MAPMGAPVRQSKSQAVYSEECKEARNKPCGCFSEAFDVRPTVRNQGCGKWADKAIDTCDSEHKTL
jgi:hypothetical protein